MNDQTGFAARPEPLNDPDLPRLLPFTKMHGAGNDYVYVEEFDAPIARPAPLAVAISDRHFGVGGDGLILMGKPSDPATADFRMRMFNADGSEGEMCGNATRCVGKYLYEKGFAKTDEFRLETLGGIRILKLAVDNGSVSSVQVNMGPPKLKPAEIPMNADGDNFIDQEFTVQGVTYRGTGVSMGNPHIVVPLQGIAELDLPRIGPAFEHHALFPRRVNTEFIEVVSRKHIRMRVWERGSGETLACGTGACATLVACALNNWTDRKAVVELRGGKLEIEWAEDGNVYMSGGAEFVFSGQYLTRA